MPDLKPRKINFESRDGFLLQGEWHPAVTERTVNSPAAIISPGMGIPARFYLPFTRHLVKHGIDVFLFDFRGIGWSSVADLSKLEADATLWGKFDLASAIDQTLLLSNGKPIIGIGHSFGGSIFGFADNIKKLHKMIHICSQSGYYGHYAFRTKLYMLFNIHLAMPILTRCLGYFPAHWLSGSEALPAGFVAEWSAWCLSKRYFMNERFSVKKQSHHADYMGPLLSLSFDDDAYATRQSVDEMAAFYSNSQLDRRHLRPQNYAAASLGHFGVFRPPNGRKIWELMVDWSLAASDVKATIQSGTMKKSSAKVN
jgi:predicted alpha/beta hydrolase